jgi:flagellar biosynthesis protein FliQ
MTPSTVIEIGRQAMEVTLLVSAPLFLAALITGLLISIVPKLVVIFVTLIAAGPWMITILTDYMRRLFESIPAMIG